MRFHATVVGVIVIFRSSRVALIVLAISAGIAYTPEVSSAQNPESVPDFVAVTLPERVTLELPAQFSLLDKDGRNVQLTHGAALDLGGVPRGTGGVLLSARSPSGPGGWAEIIVSVEHGPNATQADVEQLTAAQVRQIDQQIKSDVEATQTITGSRILEWRGSKKARLGETWSLVTRYTYIMPHDDTPREMISHRIFLGDRNIGVLLQNSRDNGASWRVILDRVEQSIRVIGAN